MDDQELKDTEKAGAQAAAEARRKTLEAIKDLEVGPRFVIENLKRLSQFKGQKPFCFQGHITYSDPLDDTGAQYSATALLAKLNNMEPPQDHQIEGTITFEVVDYSAKKDKDDCDNVKKTL